MTRPTGEGVDGSEAGTEGAGLCLSDVPVPSMLAGYRNRTVDVFQCARFLDQAFGVDEASGVDADDLKIKPKVSMDNLACL